MKEEFLSIKSKTWTRDSHGLFDYESSVVKENFLLLTKQTKLVRKKHDVKEKQENEINEADDQLVCNVLINNKKFILNTNLDKRMAPTDNNINELQNKIWYIIKPETNDQTNQTNQNPNIANENESFELKLNDIMKLGRIKYVITDYCFNGIRQSIEDNDSEAVFNLILNYNSPITDPKICCKYCLMHESNDGAALINICKCSESMSVHYSCVKTWINVKLSKKQNEDESVHSYNIKCFNCDICKTPYPLRFKYNNSIQYLIDYYIPQNKNYIILESLNQIKDGNNYKSIHVVTLEPGKKIVMGRGHEADVRINDISVSRMHGTITVTTDNKIMLKDLGSKFGTLALIQENYLCPSKKTCLQIGRSYMEIKSYPIGEYLTIKEEFKKLEKSSQLKENQIKQHSEKINHQLIGGEIPDLKQPSVISDHFDLRGLQDFMDSNEPSQNQILKIIGMRNQLKYDFLNQGGIQSGMSPMQVLNYYSVNNNNLQQNHNNIGDLNNQNRVQIPNLQLQNSNNNQIIGGLGLNNEGQSQNRGNNGQTNGNRINNFNVERSQNNNNNVQNNGNSQQQNIGDNLGNTQIPNTNSNNIFNNLIKKDDKRNSGNPGNHPYFQNNNNNKKK